MFTKSRTRYLKELTIFYSKLSLPDSCYVGPSRASIEYKELSEIIEKINKKRDIFKDDPVLPIGILVLDNRIFGIYRKES